MIMNYQQNNHLSLKKKQQTKEKNKLFKDKIGK